MRFVVEVDDKLFPDPSVVREFASKVATMVSGTCVPIKDEPDPQVLGWGTNTPKTPYEAGARMDLRMYESKVDVRIKDSDDDHLDDIIDGDDSWVDRNFIYKPTAATDGPLGEKEVNLVSSQTILGGFQDAKMHVPFIDIDMPVWLIRSKTPGHFHLCFPTVHLRWARYKALLKALKEAGIISQGYYTACAERRCSMIRAFPTPTGFKDDKPVEGWPRRLLDDEELPMEVQMGPFDDGVAVTAKRLEEGATSVGDTIPPW